MVVPSSAVKHDCVQEMLQGTLKSSKSPSLLSGPSSSQPGPSAVQVSTPHASLGLRSPNKSPSTDPVGCPPGCPPQPLAKSMRSMKEVYREWYTGLEGGRKPSVIKLDHRFGNRWRYSSSLPHGGATARRLLMQSMRKLPDVAFWQKDWGRNSMP